MTVLETAMLPRTSTWINLKSSRYSTWPSVLPVPGIMPGFCAGLNATRSVAGTGIPAGVPGIMPVLRSGVRE